VRHVLMQLLSPSAKGRSVFRPDSASGFSARVESLSGLLRHEPGPRLTEKGVDSTLALPLFTEMEDEQVNTGCDAIEEVFAQAGANGKVAAAKGEGRS
jgi:hypothetical protein